MLFASSNFDRPSGIIKEYQKIWAERFPIIKIDCTTNSITVYHQPFHYNFWRKKKWFSFYFIVTLSLAISLKSPRLRILMNDCLVFTVIKQSNYCCYILMIDFKIRHGIRHSSVNYMQRKKKKHVGLQFYRTLNRNDA